MDIALNKKDVEKDKIIFSFDKIKTFDKLLSCDLDNIIFVHNSEREYPKIFLRNQRIIRKKSMFCKRAYFKLNDSLFEPTEVNRDNFYSCGFLFYELKIRKR